jgi:tRNA modification GTPase
MFSDSIAALATPPGRSALAVIRLSGDAAIEIAASVTLGFHIDPPRQARLATFHDAAGEPIDRGLYCVFPAPHSYTGEDLIEFSCHGGLVAPARLLSALHVAGARPAHPGEFTRRAVLNGKLDLVQAEAVGDLISAMVPAQARAALYQLDGGLSRRIHQLREELVQLQALLGYQVDFPEEDDGPLPRERLVDQLSEVAARIDRLLATALAAQRVREGALVVLAGPPNAGKSSLFNALLGQGRALVTEIPGTTRDAIEAPLDLLGWPVRLVDTAGLGETNDRIDAMGMEVSRRYVEGADLVLVCVDGQTDGRTGGQPSADPALVVVGPSDRPSNRLLLHTKSDLGGAGPGMPVSALTGHGLDTLRSTIAERIFGERISLADLEPALTQARHQEALGRARTALEAARPHLAEEMGEPVLAAHHVREATLALDELLGTIDIDEVLDRIFAAFCVGK